MKLKISQTSPSSYIDLELRRVHTVRDNETNVYMLLSFFLIVSASTSICILGKKNTLFTNQQNYGRNKHPTHLAWPPIMFEYEV